jgi:HSP20 family protein
MTTLSRYTPRDELFVPFDRLFDEALNSMLGISSFNKSSFPKVDVIEYDNRLVLEADVAGLAKEDVSVDLEGDVLTIRGGNRTRDIPDANAKYVYREIKRSSFVRSFVVGDSIDKKNIKVDFQNGSLKVTLPRIKPEEKTPQKIKLL